MTMDGIDLSSVEVRKGGCPVNRGDPRLPIEVIVEVLER